MDELICPKCKSEDNYLDYEDIYERSYAVRVCEKCGCKYKCTYKIEVKNISVIDK